MEKLLAKYFRPKLPHIWCPGCGNGIVTACVARAIDKLQLDQDKTAIISGIGCSSRASGYLNFDTVHTAHGRAIPFATGVKLTKPEHNVIVLTGDGDATAIGGNHLIQAARRNLDVTMIVVNNLNYGMTGGQMAPTTLVGQKATTAPYGRDENHAGMPLRVSEMIATIPKAAFVERVSVHDVKHIIQAKKAIKKAFETQMEGKGFSLVEVLSTCPTNWGKTPIEALKWLQENMIPYYPLGNFRNTEEVK